MDGPNLAPLVELGGLLHTTKLFMIAVHCLWIYDYLLTLGDEIKYAWSGRKTRKIFVLFIVNRYTPVLHLVWIHIVMFSYSKSLCVSVIPARCILTVGPHPPRQFNSCQATKWIIILHSTTVTVAAQITVALRVYAVTGKKKLLNGPLFVISTAQLCFGLYAIARVATHSTMPLPDINLDVFKICIYERWRVGELLYINLATAFDVLAFLIIATTAKRSRTNRYPGIPSVLDSILRDATVYFMFIFAIQLVFQFFLLFAPVNIQLLPGIACTIFIPLMASRLMLSLRKAAAESLPPRYTTTTTNPNRERVQEDGTLHLASQVPGPYETGEASALPNGENIELECRPGLPRKNGSPQPR